MSEITQILERLEQARRDGAEAVLATVVNVEGSAYRKPGARMLITADGQRIGGVSGGCLEDDVVKQAWWLTETQRVALRRYDASSNDDTPTAFGLGCNGAVQVLFERIGPSDGALQAELLRAVRAGRNGAATAVVIAADQIAPGARLALFPDGSQLGALADGALSTRVFNDLKETQRHQRSLLRTYVTANGVVEVFLEYLAPPQRLVIFGAGYDAQPLVRMAWELGWRTLVADVRPHYARAERFPLADAVVMIDGDDAVDATGIDADSAVVVMTHSYEQDRQLLAQLLRDPPRYVGQLGPHQRTERLLADLRADGVAPLHADALHYPVGLDIGGNTPAHIALSILAQIQAVIAGRDSAALTERNNVVYDVAAYARNTVSAAVPL